MNRFLLLSIGMVLGLLALAGNTGAQITPAAPRVQATSVRAEAPSELSGGPPSAEMSETSSSGSVPLLRSKPDEAAPLPIQRIEVTTLDGKSLPVTLRSVRTGEYATAEVGRRAAREVLGSGKFARVLVERVTLGASVVLRLRVVARQLIASVRVDGGRLDEGDTLREARLTLGSEISPISLEESAARIRAYYAKNGYPVATVKLDPRETDDPASVALLIEVQAGPPELIRRRHFSTEPSSPPHLEIDQAIARLQDSYRVREGDLDVEEVLLAADADLQGRLRAAGFHRASVLHQVVHRAGGAFLEVRAHTGPRLTTRYEGPHAFDRDQLDEALDLEHEPDTSVGHLVDKLGDFYRQRGFWDVDVSATELGSGNDRQHALSFQVRENERLRVTDRGLPCLVGGPLSESDAWGEIDAFLAEELPSSNVGWVDPEQIDQLLGPRQTEGPRQAPLVLSPSSVLYPGSYERGLKHLQDYYRSEGYLSATVGPLQVYRKQCDPHSAPGACAVLPLSQPIHHACRFDAQGLPLEEPPVSAAALCVPDPARHVACAPQVSLRIPVKLGPQTTLYDLAFEGNRALVENALGKMSQLRLGEPLSQVEVEDARRRIVEAFHEEGFAFAEVRAVLEFSPDRTRARLRFVVNEGERVVVDRIEVRGAVRTDPDLILRRLALTVCPKGTPVAQCEPFRVSAMRTSEERVATLGTFSSVSISLLEPHVPAKRKAVLVEVQEPNPMSLDLLGGVSTGEGIRGGFEFTHRNLGGEAIALTTRVQFSYLPPRLFILDEDVVRNYKKLSVGERLERRISTSLAFPEVGLGPLIRLGVEGFDVRHNARDFGLSKDAVAASLTHRPVRSLYTQLGASLERNNVLIFNGSTVESYLSQAGINADLSRLLRLPDGTTIAVSQRITSAWDRRDNSFDAKAGTFVTSTLEHVRAFIPSSADPGTQSIEGHPRPGDVTSDFLRLTGTLSGYIPLFHQHAVLALSGRAGKIFHLFSGSVTYPDRLFFLGGVDSLRGFVQDSVVPQDLADQILSRTNLLKPDTDPTKFQLGQVGLRGGDVFVNGRAEVRVPLSGTFNGGVFLDMGNLWVDPQDFNLFRLRYASGVGLSINSPLGPIALDYGVNLYRRPWESFGAFHFSIGRF